MPVVLSSLAEEFAALLPGDQFVAGLWRATLPQSLLWTVKWQRADESGAYIAPSWSWLSSGCKVQLPHRWPSDKWAGDTVAAVQAISTKLAADDQPSGGLEAGSLKLTGFLRRVQLRFKESTFELFVYDGNDNTGRRRRIGTNWDAIQGDLCEALVDRVFPSREIKCFCLFLTIKELGQSETQTEIESLLLQSTGTDGKTFKRIGTLNFKDQYALKMQYTVKAGSKEDRRSWHTIRSRVGAVQEGKSNAKGEREPEAGGSSSRDEVSGHDRPRKSDPALLYQFDSNIQAECLERLTPQSVTLV